MEKQKKGFALLSPERHREIASLGGKASTNRHRFTPETGRIAGQKGGLAHSKAHMSWIGKKGGAEVLARHGILHMSRIGKLGGAMKKQ